MRTRLFERVWPTSCLPPQGLPRMPIRESLKPALVSHQDISDTAACGQAPTKRGQQSRRSATTGPKVRSKRRRRCPSKAASDPSRRNKPIMTNSEERSAKDKAPSAPVHSQEVGALGQPSPAHAENVRGEEPRSHRLAGQGEQSKSHTHTHTFSVRSRRAQTNNHKSFAVCQHK